MSQREKLDPDWHKARVAARIWLKAQRGKRLSPRDRRLAGLLGAERGVSNRLIQQAIFGFVGGPYRIVHMAHGPKSVLEALRSPEDFKYVVGSGN